MIGVIMVVILVLVFKSVKENARPLAMTPDEIESAMKANLTEDDLVLLSMNDNYYHRKVCSHINGPTEKVVLYLAEEKGGKPCPYCIDVEE